MDRIRGKTKLTWLRAILGGPPFAIGYRKEPQTFTLRVRPSRNTRSRPLALWLLCAAMIFAVALPSTADARPFLSRTTARHFVGKVARQKGPSVCRAR